MTKILIFISIFFSSLIFAQDEQQLPFMGGGKNVDSQFAIIHFSNQELLEGLGLNKSNIPVSEIKEYVKLSEFEKLKSKIQALLNSSLEKGYKRPKKIIFKLEKGQGDFSNEEKKELKELCENNGVKFRIEYPQINWDNRWNNKLKEYKEFLKEKYPKNSDYFEEFKLGVNQIFSKANDKVFSKIFGKYYKKPTKQEVKGGFVKMGIVIGAMSYTLPFFNNISSDSWVFWGVAVGHVFQETFFGINARSYVEFLNNNRISRITKGAIMPVIGSGIGFLALMTDRIMYSLGGHLHGDPLFAKAFVLGYIGMGVVGFLSGYLPMGIQKLTIKRWVKRSSGTNLMQGLDAAMGIEGFLLAATKQSNGNVFLKYTAAVFAVHNFVKIAVAFLGKFIPNRRFNEQLIVLPVKKLQDKIFLDNFRYKELPADKDFFKSYEGVYKFLSKEGNVQKKIEFLNYINYFLLNESKVINSNSSYKSMMKNIVKASYDVSRKVGDEIYKTNLTEFFKELPTEYKSPIDELNNLLIIDKSFDVSKFENILNKFTKGICY